MKGNLNERAMLVTLHTSVWTARKHDKRVSKEVSDAHGASENAGRYNKRLLPQDAKCYKDVTAADTFAVSLHKEQTLPWLDTCYGQRILPVTNFLPYSEKIRGARERFENAVRIFVGQYDALREEARTHLNGMFDPDDYPSAAEINGKFKFSTSTMPLPVADDFRCQLAEAEMDSIRSQIQVSVQDACNEAVKDAWKRLADALDKMSAKLHDPEGIFRNSLFENLSELCEILPRLNLYNDPLMEKVTSSVRASILAHSPDDARTDAAKRARIAKEVDKITKTMAGCL